MKCERCNGLVMAVSFVGGDDSRGAWEYDGLKCLNCGHITDPLLMKNRKLPGQGVAGHQLTPGLVAKLNPRASNAALSSR